MALIPGFLHDVFVTYSRDDNSRLGGNWIAEFTELLHKTLSDSFRRLRLETGRSVDIFLDDNDLRKDQPLTPELMERVGSSACLLVMMSPSYLRSDYCRLEREHFSQRMSNGGTLLKFDKSLFPIIIARLRPTQHDSYPMELKGGGVGYDFFKDTKLDDPRMLATGIDKAASSAERDAFLSRFNELKSGLVIKFRAAIEADARVQLPIAQPGPTPAVGNEPRGVTVAIVSTPDKSPLAATLSEKLKASGIESSVVRASSTEADLERVIAQSRTLVLLLGMPGSDRSTTVMQSLFSACRKKGAKVYACMDTAISAFVPALPDDTYGAYKRMVAAVAPESRWQGVDELAAEIVSGSNAGEPSEDDAGRDPVVIFIDNDREDRQIAEDVAAHFKQQYVRDQLTNRKIELITFLASESEPSQPDYNEKLRRRVAKCNGAVIVYSQIPEDVVVSKVKDMVKVSARQRGRRFMIAVHDGPPPKGFDVGHPSVRVIKRTEDPAYLDHLVKFVIDAAAIAN